MRNLMIVFLTASLLATPAFAERTYDYAWTDGENDILGSFDNCTGAVSTVYNLPAHPGHSVLLTKNIDAGSGYATAFLACVWGLMPGDEVTASYWRRFGASVGQTRLRLWAHYNDGLVEGEYRGQDMVVNDGLAYGNNSFGTTSDWERFEYTWTIPADHTGLVIDAILYGEYGAVVYIDELSVTVPDHAHTRVPGTYYDASGGVTAADPATWSNVKALFR